MQKPFDGKLFRNTFFAGAVLSVGYLGIGLVIGGGLAIVTANPVLAASYNGTWSVIRSGRGCTPKRYISVRIKGKRISGSYYGGSGRHNISGSISSNGSFRFTARSSRDRVSFSGKIRGKSGRGSWRVAGRSCGGSLSIRK